MIKKLTKEMTVCLLVFMFARLLISCDEKDGSSKSPADDSFIKEAGESAPLTSSITFYTHLPQRPNMQKALDEIEAGTRSLLNLDINFEVFKEHTQEEEVELLKSGKCDVIPINSNFSHLGSKGVLKDLTEIFPAKAPKLFSRFTPKDLASVTRYGQLLAILQPMPGTTRYCVIVRRDLLAKYDITEINTWDDYERFMENVKKRDSDLAPTNPGYVQTEMFIEPAGYIEIGDRMVYRREDLEMKIIPWEQTDAFRTGVETIERWQTNGYLTGRGLSFADGKLASMVSRIDRNLITQCYGTETELAIFPLYKELTAYKVPSQESIIISNYSKNPEGVVRFLEWLYESQENYDLLMYGIEGEDYKLRGDAVLHSEENANYYISDPLKPFENIEYMRNPASLSFDFKEFYKNAVELNTEYVPHTGLVCNASDVFSKVVERSNVFDSFIEMTANGSFSLNVDQFASEQIEKGANDIAASYQRQLDKLRETQHKK